MVTVCAASARAPHKHSHQGMQQHICAICCKDFGHRSDLLVHQRIHTVERPFPHPECGCSFSDCSNLTKHQCMQMGEKPYHCELCSKHFTSVFNLNVYQSNHTGHKPLKCPQCGKAFSTGTELVPPHKRHLGQPKAQCAECGKCFSHNHWLSQNQQAHIQAHTTSATTRDTTAAALIFAAQVGQQQQGLFVFQLKEPFFREVQRLPWTVLGTSDKSVTGWWANSQSGVCAKIAVCHLYSSQVTTSTSLSALFLYSVLLLWRGEAGRSNWCSQDKPPDPHTWETLGMGVPQSLCFSVFQCSF